MSPLERLKRTVTKDESQCHSDSIIAPIVASRRHKTVGYDNTWAAKWFIPVLQTQAELKLIMSCRKPDVLFLELQCNSFTQNPIV